MAQDGTPGHGGRAWEERVHSAPPLPLSGQKADKSALAATVTRVQFDAATEQLNKMMQELVAKVSGQEQDWQKMLDKILVEMDTKVRVRQGPGLETTLPFVGGFQAA